MPSLIKKIKDKIRRNRYRKINVKIRRNAIFDDNTTFEGYNVVHTGADIRKSSLGLATYIGIDSKLPNCQIGRYCSIGNNVQVIATTHPSHTFVSTHPIFFSPLRQAGITFTDKPLFDEFVTINGKYAIIENDVWIASNATIMGGLKIGTGAIIAAGAVVTHDVPPYAIVAGVPARIIKYRFDQNQIKDLLQSQWWNLPIQQLQSQYTQFSDINKFLNTQGNERKRE